jgi:ParD-like antitoxin of type II bacterial toxin-antitoxin system
MFEALANPPRIPAPAPNYQSVKLPSSLVAAAKEQAQTFRRSTAGQIEYWATLGKSMEINGLTAQQAKAAVTAHDEDVFGKALIAKFMAFEQSGQLAAGIQQVVEENKQKAIARG